MYKCISCKNEFEEPFVFYEAHELDSEPYEKWRTCPKCSSTYIEFINEKGESQGDA